MCLWDAGTEPPSEDAMVHGRTTSHMGTCVPRSTGPGWSLDQGPSTGPRTGVVGGHSDHHNSHITKTSARDFHAQTEPVPYSSLQQQTG
jgi:hypothetical protein